MKNNLAVFFVGLIFALGLGISGMTRPEKVIGFLDIFGNWDPSLMFVMNSASSSANRRRLIKRLAHSHQTRH